MKLHKFGLLLALTCSLMAETAQPPRIQKLKKLFPETPLVRDGRAASFIVLPDKDDLSATVEKLRATIRARTGADLHALRADDLVDEDWRIDFSKVVSSNLIALGNVNNNRLLSVLYGERYVVADSIYPGEGGYVVRTVHDPFAKGFNVLVLAGSNRAGVDKAVDVFIAKHAKAIGTSLVLKRPIIDVEFAKKAYRFFPDATHVLSSKRQPQYTGMQWFRDRLKESGFMNDEGDVVTNSNLKTSLVALTGWLARIEQTWFRTGNRELIPLMKELIEKNRSLLKNQAQLQGMGARSAVHVAAWDRLEELPIWSKKDRLEITNALLMDASLGHERRAFHQQVKGGAVQALDENHGTNSALRSFEAWHYFHKYYRLPESEYWLKCASAVFSAQAGTYQILEDASGYLCYCPIATMDYSLRRADLTYFKRGIARHHARFVALACINNLGLNTGFGDSAGVVQPAFFELLAPAAWFYRDAGLYWIVRNTMPSSNGLRVFQKSIAVDLSIEPKTPKDWTGLIRFPLYEAPLAKGESTKTASFAPKKEVDEKFFNKIVFKENWSPDGQYLLLDGAGTWGGPPGPHGHKQNDINTIVNFTSHGRMWLVDHTYNLRGFEHHSGLYVTRNGSGGYRKRTLAELLGHSETRDYGLIRSRFLNWERSIIWKKGSWFVVLDQVIADQDGDFFARSSWRTLGEEKLLGRNLELKQQGKTCRILSDGRANVDIETYAFTHERDWRTFYPHAEPVVKIFQQDKARHLKKGERIGFINLLHAFDTSAEPGIELTAASEFCAVIQEGDAQTLVGTGTIPGGLGEAELFILDSDGLTVLGEKTIPNEPGQKAIAGAIAVAMKATARDSVVQSVSRGREVSGMEVRQVELGTGLRTFLVSSTLDAAHKDARESGTWIVGTDNGVAAFRPSGERMWSFETGHPVRALDIGDINDDGIPEIVAGCDDHHVYLLDRSGKKVWSYKCKPSTDRNGGPPKVDFVEITDLEGDGKSELVVGANWVHVLKADGSLKWEKYMRFWRGMVVGDFACASISDINGDGSREIVAAFHASYPLFQVFDASGKVILPEGTKEGEGINISVPLQVDCVDLFGGKSTRNIVCTTTQAMNFFWSDHRPKEEGGGKVRGSFVASAYHQPDPNQRPLLFGADSMCGVKGIRPESKRSDRWIPAKVIWYRNLGEKISAIQAVETGEKDGGVIYIGTKLGSVYACRASDGETLGHARIPGPPVKCFALDIERKEILAARKDGHILRLSLRSQDR